MDDPTLVSRDVFWPTVVETYDTGFSKAFNDAFAAEILDHENSAHLTPDSGQIGRFPAFSSLLTKQEIEKWGSSAVGALSDIVRVLSSRYIQRNVQQDWPITQIVMWANVHRAGNWHAPHSHYTGGGETLSGAYWVVAPDIATEVETNGAFVLTDSRGPYHPGRQRKIITPRVGHLLLFPSWQQHYVTPVNTGVLRVSVGFDVHCGRVIP